MTSTDLKEYTNRAKELEVAIYTHKKLMEEHNTIMQISYPKKPQKKVYEKPIAPSVPVLRDNPNDNDNAYAIGGTILIAILSIWALTSSNGVCIFLGVVGIVVAILAAIGAYNSMTSSSKAWEREMDVYRQRTKEYHELLSKYEENKQIAENTYEMEMSDYNQKCEKHNDDNSKMIENYDTALLLLENALHELYDQNLIFPKYRNLVAITTINEYLASGRCYELEGPNGAYNLYEMELRQNIVIGQLSNIIDNLEQIRNNQFTLYEELNKSKAMVSDIVRELRILNKTEKLNAYFSYVTALAETSPKVTYGRIYSC